MSAAGKYVLAIDMGTGSIKTALVSKEGEVVASAQRDLETIHLDDGGVEQSPQQWWEATLAAARETVATAAVAPASVIAVKCVTQWAVTVAVDAGGEPLGNAISWMDTRGGKYVRALVDGRFGCGGYDAFKLRRWIRLTGGCPARAGVDSFGHILFLKNARPEIYARAAKLLEPMDYLNLRLSGKAAASYGTVFPYWLTDNRDPDRIDYDPGLLALSAIDRAKLPDLLPVDAVVGTLRPEVAAELGLEPSTQVMTGACDSQSATVGAGTIRDGDGYFYIGSSAWMSCHVRRKKTDILHSLLTMPAALPGRYTVMAEQGMAGRCLEHLKDRILFLEAHGGDLYRQLDDEAARVAPGSDGLIFTPWINGVLAPVSDRHTRSAFFNQSARTTRSHYVRAVMEGVAFNLRWLKKYVEAFAGTRFAHLNFIGGAALSPVWCQIHADVLGCPVRQVANPRFANAVGAAMTAFVALGEIRAEQIEDIIKIAGVFHPDPAQQRTYDRQFEAFLAIYRRLKPVYRRLNRHG